MIRSRRWTVVAVVYGVAAFIGSFAASIVLTRFRDPMATMRHVDQGHLDGVGLRFAILHRVAFASIQTDERAVVNTAWWRFDYLHWDPNLTPRGHGDPVTWRSYTVRETYMISDASLLLPWNSYGLGPTTFPEILLFGLPPLVLMVAGGIAAVRLAEGRPTSGALVGASIVLGYLAMTVLFIHLVSANYDQPRGMMPPFLLFPDPIVAIVRMGIVYPLVFGALGGAVGAWIDGVVEERYRGATDRSEIQ